MSDNIQRAIAFIQAEIEHTRRGVVHYEQQVNSLQAALNQLGGMSDSAQTVITKEKRGRKPKGESDSPTKVGSGKKGKGGLPFTGGDFWESLVSSTPQAGKDVLAAAIKKTGIKPNADQTRKLTSRMVFALNALVKAGKIKDSGRGRERRFFKQ